MKKFLVLYHMPASAMESTGEPSSEDMQESMKLWMAWAEKCGDGLVDFGTPLAGGQKLSKSGSSPSDTNTVGYSILQADDMEEVKALLRGHPHLEWSDVCEIEVHESMPTPSM